MERPVLVAADFEVFIFSGPLPIRAEDLFPKNGKLSPIQIQGHFIYPTEWTLKVSLPPFNSRPLAFYKAIRKGFRLLKEYMRRTFNNRFQIKLSSDNALYPKPGDSILPYEESIVDTINVVSSGIHIKLVGVKNKPQLKEMLRCTIGKFYKFIGAGFNSRLNYAGDNIYTSGFGYSLLGGTCLRTVPLLCISLLLFYSIKYYS